MKHTHYHPKTKTWFTPDHCETCGGEIQAPNSVNLHGPQSFIDTLIHVDKLPCEGSYDENTHKEVCENCR